MKNINFVKEVIEMIESFDNKHQDVLKENDKANNKRFLEILNKMLDGSLKYNEKIVKAQKKVIESLNKIYSF